MSLPPELLHQIVKELISRPSRNSESLTWSEDRASLSSLSYIRLLFRVRIESREESTLAELQAQALTDPDLQPFTLLYVNNQLRTTALEVFHNQGSGDWDNDTYAQRLDNMQDEEARVIFDNIYGQKAKLGRRPCNIRDMFSLVEVERLLKIWERSRGYWGSDAVWEKVRCLAMDPGVF